MTTLSRASKRIVISPIAAEVFKLIRGSSVHTLLHQKTYDHQYYHKNQESGTDNVGACVSQSEGRGEGGETTITP